MKMIPCLTLLLAAGMVFAEPPAAPRSPAAAAPAPAASTPISGKPRIEFSEKKHNFGRILNIDHPETFLTFRNTGDAPLIIKRIVKSCACTEPTLLPAGKTEFAPGEEGQIKIGLSAREKHGHAEVDLKVESNDPEHPTTVLYLLADVDRVVELDPVVVNFGDVRKGEKKELDLKVVGRTPDFKATYLSINYYEKGEPPVSWKIISTDPYEFQGQTVRATTIRLTLAPQENAFRKEWGIGVRTNDPRMDNLGSKIQVNVISDLETSTPTIMLGSLTPGQSFVGNIRVTSRSRTPFKVLKVENPADLSVSYDLTPTKALSIGLKPGDLPPPENTKEKPYSYLVRVSGTAPMRHGEYTGEIILKTDLKGDETVKIPFRAVLRDPPAAPTTVPTTPTQTPGVLTPVSPTPPASPKGGR